MKVVLLQTVKKLGEEGEIKEVADGYARNYLIPKGLAMEATQKKIKEIQEQSEKMQRSKAREQQAAQEVKEKIDGKMIELKAKTGGGDKLFGAVTGKEISDQLSRDFAVALDKKKIEMPEPIKHVGEYAVRVKIYPGIQAEIQVKVVAQ